MHPILSIHGGFSLPTYGLIVFVVVVGSTAWLTGFAPATRLLRPWQIVESVAIGLAVGTVASRLLLWALGVRGEGIAIAMTRSAGFVQAGALFGLLALALYLRGRGKAVLATLDVLIPVLPLAQAGGRLGCLAAGCCYGRPAELPWALIYTEPTAASMTGVPLGVALHPTPLYATAMSAVVFVATVVVVRRGHAARGHAAGTALGVYLLGDGVARLSLQPFRADWPSALAAPPALVFAVIGVTAGLLLIARARWRRAVVT